MRKTNKFYILSDDYSSSIVGNINVYISKDLSVNVPLLVGNGYSYTTKTYASQYDSSRSIVLNNYIYGGASQYNQGDIIVIY